MTGAGDCRIFVHERGLCESGDVGDGTRIWAFAHVMAGARVGRECNLGDHVFVESGAVIGDGVTVKNGVQVWDGVTVADGVFLGPAMVFTNDRTPRAFAEDFERVETRVEAGASIGANATVVCGVTIGSHAMVGAGSVITRDVPPFALMAGNPARRIGWACRCGLRLPEDLACRCGLSYREGREGAGSSGLLPA